MFLADAWLLWGLVPLFAAWALAWVWQRKRTPAAVTFSSLHAVQALRPSLVARLLPAVQGLRLVVVGLLLAALARPVTTRANARVTSRGIDIMLAVDTSGSMRALDLDKDKPIRERRNRLEVVRDVVAQFVAERPSDQVGMVVFGELAFTQSPLTLDKELLSRFIGRLEIGMAGDATAVGDALATALKRLQSSPSRSKIVVLLTDGKSNAGTVEPMQAAELAKAVGVRVYTVGAGTRGRAPIVVQGFFGPELKEVPVDIDEDTLQRIAELTGGEYFRAEDAAGLTQAYARIDALEKTELTGIDFREYDEHFARFLWPALGLLLVELVLLGTRWRRAP